MEIRKKDCAKIINNYTEYLLNLDRIAKFIKENIDYIESLYKKQHEGEQADARIQKYMDLPYSIIIQKRTGLEVFYTAMIAEFGTDIVSGSTYEEAHNKIMEWLWLEIKYRLDHKIPIPEPINK